MDRQGLQEVGRARGRRAAASALAALLLAGPAGARPLEYLYVEPNAGTASGGHVALRIGDRVHHYQHADGALRSARYSADWFRYLYSVLENRTIHVARIDVDDETWEALDARFRERGTVEQQHFAVQRALGDDRAVLEGLLARARERAGTERVWMKSVTLERDLGELESARILVGGLLESGEITDPRELKFLENKLRELESQGVEISTGR